MGGMAPGAGAGGAHAREALQANLPPQLIEMVLRGINAQQLADRLHIPADQAAALIQAVRGGEITTPVLSLCTCPEVVCVRRLWADV